MAPRGLKVRVLLGRVDLALKGDGAQVEKSQDYFYFCSFLKVPEEYHGERNIRVLFSPVRIFVRRGRAMSPKIQEERAETREVGLLDFWSEDQNSLQDSPAQGDQDVLLGFVVLCSLCVPGNGNSCACVEWGCVYACTCVCTGVCVSKHCRMDLVQRTRVY